MAKKRTKKLHKWSKHDAEALGVKTKYLERQINFLEKEISEIQNDINEIYNSLAWLEEQHKELSK